MNEPERRTDSAQDKLGPVAVEAAAPEMLRTKNNATHVTSNQTRLVTAVLLKSSMGKTVNTTSIPRMDSTIRKVST